MWQVGCYSAGGGAVSGVWLGRVESREFIRARGEPQPTTPPLFKDAKPPGGERLRWVPPPDGATGPSPARRYLAAEKGAAAGSPLRSQREMGARRAPARDGSPPADPGLCPRAPQSHHPPAVAVALVHPAGLHHLRGGVARQPACPGSWGGLGVFGGVAPPGVSDEQRRGASHLSQGAQ